ncbi:MAG: hypothetical protein ABIF85_05505 [Nanoarchaeota archaeon]
MKRRKSSRSAIASLEAFEGSLTSKSSRSVSLHSKLFFGRRKKAQWFIVGAFLIITMISAVIMGKNAVNLSDDLDPLQRQIYKNIKADIDIALNSVLYEERTSENLQMRLKDYSNFIRDFGKIHTINISTYLIVGLPSGNDINVTVINFQKTAMQPIEITINGTTKNISMLLDGTAETVTFTSVPDYFTVSYTIATPGESLPESESINMTKRVFSAVKLRVESRDKSQVWQKVGWS